MLGIFAITILRYLAMYVYAYCVTGSNGEEFSRDRAEQDRCRYPSVAFLRKLYFVP